MQEVLDRSAVPPAPLELARMEIAFGMPTMRHIDLDNLSAQCKAYVDCLVDNGVLTDDRWQIIPSRTYSAELSRREPWFEIRFWKLPADGQNPKEAGPTKLPKRKKTKRRPPGLQTEKHTQARLI